MRNFVGVDRPTLHNLSRVDPSNSAEWSESKTARLQRKLNTLRPVRRCPHNYKDTKQTNK